MTDICQRKESTLLIKAQRQQIQFTIADRTNEIASKDL